MMDVYVINDYIDHRIEETLVAKVNIFICLLLWIPTKHMSLEREVM